MVLLPANSSYTDKEFDSLKDRLQNLLRSTFPDWTDFSIASFGNILLEMYAFVGDVLTFYQDASARESRIITATQRRNVIALAKLIGYKLPGARAATADVEFTLAAPPAADVTIPVGTIVRTQEVTDPVFFQLLSDVTIKADSEPPTTTGTVENSTTQEQLFTSTGLANQEVVLDYLLYLDDSAQINASNGGYEEVENFLDSTAEDRHFVVIVDQNDRATIRFGNGINGAVPTGTITISYKTGGGRNGIVDAERIVIIEGSFTDANGNPVQVSVRNPLPSSGGQDRQSIAQAKILAPASIRTLNRTVSREDYEVNALRLQNVARALMLTSNEKPTISENSGILFIIPSGGGTPRDPHLWQPHQFIEQY